MVLQFPGIILMGKTPNCDICYTLIALLAVIIPKTSYRAVEWVPIAGGIGVYDSKSVTSALNGPWVSGLVLNFLKDSTVSIQTDPISHNCLVSGSCSSYLLPGGLQTVTPWPFFKSNDSSLSFYITKNGPAYQLDFWTVPDGFTWSQFECQIYGHDVNSTFQLCLSSNGVNSEIYAGTVTFLNSELVTNAACQVGGPAFTISSHPVNATSLNLGICFQPNQPQFQSTAAVQR